MMAVAEMHLNCCVLIINEDTLDHKHGLLTIALGWVGDLSLWIASGFLNLT